LKTCIWCNNEETETAFNKKAHTIPQALGGKNICENVCDRCNHYFGAATNRTPSIETVIKETFGITRARLLHSQNEIGKNKALSKFSSEYFKLDLKNPRLSLKQKYRLNKSFQEKIGRQMKRGLYKIYLEENERQFGTSLDPKYDFIREFSRYDIGDYPVFYFERLHGVILMSMELAKNPVLLLEEDLKMKYLISHNSFLEFEFLGHVFVLATSRHWDIAYDNYIKRTLEPKRKYFKYIRAVSRFNDIDLSLSILND
jgi:hypothetical protein